MAAQEHRLNARQAAALDHALVHGKLTLGDFEQRFPDTNRRSLQRDLRAMVEKGLLKEVGGSTDPTRHYTPGKL